MQYLSIPSSFYMNGKLLIIDGGHLSFYGTKLWEEYANVSYSIAGFGSYKTFMRQMATRCENDKIVQNIFLYNYIEVGNEARNNSVQNINIFFNEHTKNIWNCSK